MLLVAVVLVRCIPIGFFHHTTSIVPVAVRRLIVHRVSQIARLLSFDEYQTLVSGNESESFIAFRKSPVSCCLMNSESFHGQPLPFHAPPPAPAFTFIYCAVNVNAPADRFQEDSSDLAERCSIPTSSSSCALAFVCRLRRAAGGRVCVRVVVVINFPSAYICTYLRTYLHIALTCGRYDFEVK